MNRRSFLSTATGASTVAASAFLSAQKAFSKNKGRLKQGVTKGVFRGANMSLDDMCREAANLGIYGFDLIDPKDWPILKKYGLVPTMTPPPYAGTIPDGINQRDNHASLEESTRKIIDLAAAEKCPNVITLSGNRRGMPDEEGAANSVVFLNKVKGQAEDKGVTICLELLNSKVNHKDYMCDHTAWGVEVMKQVNSPHVKLLYDIYHMQIMEGDVIRTIRDNIQYIGHFHTGGNPGRHEIDESQELNYHAVAQAIADTGFSGVISHEYTPAGVPLVSLKRAIEICTV
jgi:hydroxypyruvate isomerase